MTGMIVTVTGGGGFIGSKLVRALRGSGFAVRTLLGPAGSKIVLPPDDVEACFGEIDDPTVLRPLISGSSVVVHLAGPPSVAASFAAPLDYSRAHVTGTAAVVEACAQAGVRRLVYVSSAEVYGQPHQNPVDEEAAISPRSPYAAAKVGAEGFIRAGVAATRLEAIIVRPFLVYGPGMPPTTLIGSLVRQVQRTNILKVFDPRPIRDYCFVDDVVEALSLSCSAALTRNLCVYNLGGGQGISVGDLAERLLAMQWGGGTVEVAHENDRPAPAAILELVSDPPRAFRELAWQASTGIDAGLAEMLRQPLGDGQ
jgi:nucleoside-diphosphate-sugar epimerase